MIAIGEELRPRTRATRRRAAGAAALVAALLVSAVALAAAPAAVAQNLAAPTVTVSADGLRATDGTRVLSSSKTQGLSEQGEQITVTGSGYNVNKGIYVAVCVVPPVGLQPTPCGGGADQAGTTGASKWFSDRPPSYGEGLAVPYGPGGSFTATLDLRPVIAAGYDCRTIACAIVTRNDHIRSADRTQDIFLPIAFGAAPGGSGATPSTSPESTTTTIAPTTTTTAAPTTTTTATTVAVASPPPQATLAADGRSTTDGTRTLAVATVADLDPDGEPVVVTGTGFDAGKGVTVGYCAIPADGGPPSPCAASNVTAGPAKVADAIDADDLGSAGSFETTITVSPRIDAETTCDAGRCAVVVLPAPDRPQDRSQELAVPVRFAVAVAATPAPAPPTTAAPLAAAPTEVSSTSTSPLPWVLGGVAVLVVAAVVAGLLIARRRGEDDAPALPADEPSDPAAEPSPTSAP